MNVTFYGVRGSTPCSSDEIKRYGGNTACVALEAPGHEPLILDIGTGLRFFGQTQPVDGTFHGHALVSHLHWDHVQGLPFFTPIHQPGATLDLYGPPQAGGRNLGEVFDQFMCPPYFPIRCRDLAGSVRFHVMDAGEHAVGDAKVRSRSVPHVGPTNGYRVEMAGASVAYLPDHQQPLDGSHGVSPEVVDLCDGADLLIHDAQFTPEEFAVKAHWGHCTVDYALTVAAESGCRRVALFHHDPGHDDDTLDRLLDAARRRGVELGLDEVFAAHEGLTVNFS